VTYRGNRRARGYQQRWTKGSFRDPSQPIGPGSRRPRPVDPESPWAQPDRLTPEEEEARAARVRAEQELTEAPF